MKILVAIDGSENALRALDYAIGLAGKLSGKAELVLINVHDDAALHSASKALGSKAVKDYLADLSKEQLADAVAKAAASGLEHQTVIATGPISATIVNEADARQVDLIVLGTKGRGGLRDWLIGSVAQRVSASGSIPVLLVK
ncbi:MAG: universal stress protein [Lautropia sp.]